MSLDMIREKIIASIKIKQAIIEDEKLLCKIQKLANDCVHSLRSGGKIIFAGNGGSFADAQHLSAEFISRFMFDRAALASIVLGANNSTLTAIGNDYGYEQVFAREIAGLAKEKDIFIPISTSGNSQNILEAVKRANEMGIITVALTGYEGGKLQHICSCITVSSEDTARIQESHIMIGHIICGLVEQNIFGGQ